MEDETTKLAKKAGWTTNRRLTPYQYLDEYISGPDNFMTYYVSMVFLGFLTGLLAGYFFN